MSINRISGPTAIGIVASMYAQNTKTNSGTPIQFSTPVCEVTISQAAKDMAAKWSTTPNTDPFHIVTTNVENAANFENLIGVPK